MGIIVNTAKNPWRGAFIDNLASNLYKGSKACYTISKCRYISQDVTQGIVYGDFISEAICSAGLLALCLVPHAQLKVWSPGMTIAHVTALSAISKGLKRVPMTKFSEQDPLE